MFSIITSFSSLAIHHLDVLANLLGHTLGQATILKGYLRPPYLKGHHKKLCMLRMKPLTSTLTFKNMAAEAESSEGLSLLLCFHSELFAERYANLRMEFAIQPQAKQTLFLAVVGFHFQKFLLAISGIKL